VKKGCAVILGLIAAAAILSLMIALFYKGAPVGEKVALVRVEGAIMDSKNTVEEIKEYVKDASVKAIVLKVDSPGVAFAASQEIYE